MYNIDKLYCIRIIKLPPATIRLGTAFEIALSITDDVGTALPGYGQIPRASHLEHCALSWPDAG
jgi:hypothetical protein